jgi:hypothetical protein
MDANLAGMVNGFGVFIAVRFVAKTREYATDGPRPEWLMSNRQAKQLVDTAEANGYISTTTDART